MAECPRSLFEVSTKYSETSLNRRNLLIKSQSIVCSCSMTNLQLLAVGKTVDTIYFKSHTWYSHESPTLAILFQQIEHCLEHSSSLAFKIYFIPMLTGFYKLRTLIILSLNLMGVMFLYSTPERVDYRPTCTSTWPSSRSTSTILTISTRISSPSQHNPTTESANVEIWTTRH